MQARDKFLRKVSLFLFFIFLSPSMSFAQQDIVKKILNHNISLKNSSANFIQTDGATIEEGVVYIGDERIKIEYVNPRKITITLSKKRGMYVNHELKETQFFNTKKNFINIIFKILTGENYFEISDLEFYKNTITIKNQFEIDNKIYFIESVYENNPVKLRKIKVLENEFGFEVGIGEQKKQGVFGRNFFSLIDPYLKN